MRYNFEWDPVKARENLRKHKVSFGRAAQIFWDPFANSVFDDAHSEVEDRWVTIGKDGNHVLLLVVHTFREETEDECNIRIISARKATKKELQQYKGGHR